MYVNWKWLFCNFLLRCLVLSQLWQGWTTWNLAYWNSQLFPYASAPIFNLVAKPQNAYCMPDSVLWTKCNHSHFNPPPPFYSRGSSSGKTSGRGGRLPEPSLLPLYTLPPYHMLLPPCTLPSEPFPLRDICMSPNFSSPAACFLNYQDAHDVCFLCFPMLQYQVFLPSVAHCSMALWWVLLLLGSPLIPLPLSGSTLGSVLLLGSMLSQGMVKESVRSQGTVQNPVLTAGTAFLLVTWF